MLTAEKKKSPPATDGRVRRSERSRAAIVQALFELIGEGVLLPTADEVADRAAIGIRTVFRQFKDMDTLPCARARGFHRGANR
jgi:AcrR family transcriptional regulator